LVFFFFHFLTDIKFDTAPITDNIHVTWTKANTSCSFCSQCLWSA
jgi:hypothetical protein